MCKAEIPTSPLNVGSLLALGWRASRKGQGRQGERDEVGCNLEKSNSYIHGTPADWTYGVHYWEINFLKKTKWFVSRFKMNVLVPMPAGAEITNVETELKLELCLGWPPVSPSKIGVSKKLGCSLTSFWGDECNTQTKSGYCTCKSIGDSIRN